MANMHVMYHTSRAYWPSLSESWLAGQEASDDLFGESEWPDDEEFQDLNLFRDDERAHLSQSDLEVAGRQSQGGCAKVASCCFARHPDARCRFCWPRRCLGSFAWCAACALCAVAAPESLSRFPSPSSDSLGMVVQCKTTSNMEDAVHARPIIISMKEAAMQRLHDRWDRMVEKSGDVMFETGHLTLPSYECTGTFCQLCHRLLHSKFDRLVAVEVKISVCS